MRNKKLQLLINQMRVANQQDLQQLFELVETSIRHDADIIRKTKKVLKTIADISLVITVIVQWVLGVL